MGKKLTPLPEGEKICSCCFLPFSYRKKWEKTWDQVKFCSDRCRRQKNSKIKAKIEEEILRLAQARRPASFCPSEVPRLLFENWRDHLETTRQVARKLLLEGKIEITQQGKSIESLRFRGPVRLKAPS